MAVLASVDVGRPRSTAAALLVVASVTSACQREPDASRTGTGTGSAASAAPLEDLLPAPDPATSPAASATPSAVPAVDADGADAAAHGEPTGVTWSRCAEGFRAGGGARRDLVRLSALCGPPNGQKRVGSTVEGDAPGPVEVRFDAADGDCVRAFAAADPKVGPLALELVDPSGRVVATESGAGRWGVLRSDRPVCVKGSGSYVVRARARGGAGKVAVEAWVLP